MDVVAASRHDEFLAEDYARLTAAGIRTVREGARWHVIEHKPGLRDFSSLEAVFAAADEAGVEVILDLMHFGWPDFLQVFSPGFIRAFESFALATARFLRRRGTHALSVIPINEISFLTWAGGDQALMNPHERGRGIHLKRQLVKAAIAASRVLKQEVPGVRLVSAEPVIHIVPRAGVEGDAAACERHRLSMYEATDMLTGRSNPELGGSSDLIDVIGLNFYDRNQWVHCERTLHRTDPNYRRLRDLLAEVAHRYRKPLLMTETGAEDEARAAWFDYVCEEVRASMIAGVDVRGICLYPIVNHPGWDDDRHCCNGVWDYADDDGERAAYLPLTDAIARQQSVFASLLKAAA